MTMLQLSSMRTKGIEEMGEAKIKVDKLGRKRKLTRLNRQRKDELNKNKGKSKEKQQQGNSISFSVPSVHYKCQLYAYHRQDSLQALPPIKSKYLTHSKCYHTQSVKSDIYTDSNVNCTLQDHQVHSSRQNQVLADYIPRKRVENETTILLLFVSITNFQKVSVLQFKWTLRTSVTPISQPIYEMAQYTLVTSCLRLL